jgi:hypothetical protein
VYRSHSVVLGTGSVPYMHPWLNQFVEHEQLTIKQLVLLSLIHLVFIEEPSVQEHLVISDVCTQGVCVFFFN